MRIGTKSVLFGAHCFFLHPFFVAAAWNRLYGFPFDPRLWVAFFVHDLGYIGKPNMDGDEGESHPEFGAKIMRIFGKDWHDFCLYHSRFYAKKNGGEPSKLCAADKLAFSYTPSWLYIPMASATGEIDEYMSDFLNGKYTHQAQGFSASSKQVWHHSVHRYMLRYIVSIKDGGKDTITKVDRFSKSNGVY